MINSIVLLTFVVIFGISTTVLTILYVTKFNCENCINNEVVEEEEEEVTEVEEVDELSAENFSTADLIFDAATQIELVQIMSDNLKKWGVLHYVAFGSLLGIMRYGEPIKDDHDSDMNVYGPHAGIVLQNLQFLKTKYSIELIRSDKTINDLQSYKDDSINSMLSLKYKRNYIDLYFTSWMPNTIDFSNKNYTDILLPENSWDNLSAVYKNPREVDGTDNGRSFVKDGQSFLRQPGRSTTYFKNNVIIDFFDY
jgi:hypothetical protein